MANWKTFRITHTLVNSNAAYLYLDGVMTFFDVTNEPRVIISNDNYYKQYLSHLGRNDYIEIDLDKVADFPYRETIPSVICARPASSSSVSRVSTRDAMISAASVDQTALTITREGIERINRGEITEFEYKMEDRSGNKHHWIYRK